MASPNFSGDGQQKTVEDFPCSLYLTSGLHGHLPFLSVLNSFLSVTAFLGNALILFALHKESSLHPPSKLLLRNLATTDLCVGLISQPFAVIYWMSVANEHWNIRPYAFVAQLITSYILCGVSVSTLTAISVERLFALLLRLRYKQVVTLKRTYVIVIAILVVSTVSTVMWFWNPVITLQCGIVVTCLCLVISSFSYTKIFLILCHHQNEIQDHVQQPNQTNQLNIARYKKAVSTAIWLQLTLVACYLPFGVVTALATSGRRSSAVSNAWNYKCSQFGLLKLVIKPDSLLLEDRRSQASSEEHNQTSALPLFFELAVVDQHGEEIKL